MYTLIEKLSQECLVTKKTFRGTSTTSWNVPLAGNVFSTTFQCKHFIYWSPKLVWIFNFIQNQERAFWRHCKQFWNATVTSEWMKYLVTIWFRKHVAHIIGKGKVWMYTYMITNWCLFCQVQDIIFQNSDSKQRYSDWQNHIYVTANMLY